MFLLDALAALRPSSKFEDAQHVEHHLSHRRTISFFMEVPTSLTVNNGSKELFRVHLKLKVAQILIVCSTTHRQRISLRAILFFFDCVTFSSVAAKELSVISFAALSPYILIWLVSPPSPDLPAWLSLKPQPLQLSENSSSPWRAYFRISLWCVYMWAYYSPQSFPVQMV